jgi:hypothetical protein
VNTTVWTEILSAIATLAAVIIALWVAIFGTRRIAKPKLCVSVDLEPPDCMWDTSSEENAGDTGLAQGRYFSRLRLTNEGNEDARDVEVMMIRLWVVDSYGRRLMDPSFLPLLLQWSWWVRDAGPSRWLERLPTGTFKHCDLLTVTLEQGPRPGLRRRRSAEKNGRPKSWMTFKPAYDPSDSSGHNPLRKPPGRYELEFVAAASNATAIYRTARITFTGWKDNPAEMFGETGGLHIEITETEKVG